MKRIRIYRNQIYIEDLASHRQVRGDEAAALLFRHIPAGDEIFTT